jgi:DNA-binding NtrC family response regulator
MKVEDAQTDAVDALRHARLVRDARVLIVEDEVALRESLMRFVNEWGYPATSFWSGEDAAAANAAKPFDIAILDLSLPGIDGIETLGRLRQQSPQLQGIILTGSASIDAARRAIHLGIVEFLTKPCNRGELEQALDRARRRLAPLRPLVRTDRTEEGGGRKEAQTLEEVERTHVLAALAQNKGDRTTTAKQLGVSRKTLYNKLRDYIRQGFSPR